MTITPRRTDLPVFLRAKRGGLRASSFSFGRKRSVNRMLRPPTWMHSMTKNGVGGDESVITSAEIMAHFVPELPSGADDTAFLCGPSAFFPPASGAAQPPKNYSTSVDPISYPKEFGAPGSVLLRNSTLPTRSHPESPQYPITPLRTNSLNGFDPNLKMGYVQSWNIGYRREIGKGNVIEVRDTGNHGVKLWRQVNLNKVNIFENEFLKEFNQAQTNLFINRGCSGSWTSCTSPTSNNFGNAGLAGQGPVPIISTAYGTTTDTTFADYIRQNRPGTIANTLATSATYMGRLTAAGYAANLFQVNPTVASGGSWLLANMGDSYCHALQVEFNRRMSAGLLFQASYVWANSVVNGNMSNLVDAAQPQSFRDRRQDRVPAGYDIRHALKFNGIYELPFGPGRRWGSGWNRVLTKVLEGWQISGISRIQSGAAFQLTSGRSGMNNNEAGVVLYNITARELQKKVRIRKTIGSDGKEIVFWLPDDIIANTGAAFEWGGKTWANLDKNAPYVGPQLAQNQFGYMVFLRNPWQYQLDTALIKRTQIREKAAVDFRARFLNVLNLTNFFIASGPNSTSFGKTTSYYNDFSGSANPGSRVIEFQLRITY